MDVISDDRYLGCEDKCADQNPLACPPLVGYSELGPYSFKIYESDEDDRDVDA